MSFSAKFFLAMIGMAVFILAVSMLTGCLMVFDC
jgi:hypothetical protein